MKYQKHKSKIAVIAATLLFASCSTKPCRCYLLERWGNVPVSETYIDRDTPCSELGYSRLNPDDSSYRLCTEIDAPLIDTMDIVRMFWG
jgi:hypothetical protein